MGFDFQGELLRNNNSHHSWLTSAKIATYWSVSSTRYTLKLQKEAQRRYLNGSLCTSKSFRYVVFAMPKIVGLIDSETCEKYHLRRPVL